MTKAFLRQPDMLVITPSNQSPWVGHVDAPDDRFTRAQLYQMGQRGMVPETVEAITVYREATSREMWWPTGAPAPVFQFDCPVLERRRDGKVKVMAPSGEGKFVLANGWVREPSRRNRHILAAQEASRRAAIGAAGLAAVLLASMLFRAVIAARTPATPATVVVAQIRGDL